MRRHALFLPALGIALGASAATAQEQGPPEMYFLAQDFVKPSMIQQYEAAGKSFLEDLASTPNAMETIRYITVSGTEVGYVYVVPVKGWAGVGKAFADWEAAGKAMGEQKWMQHMNRSSGMLDHQATSMIMLRPDLSYKLETTALTPAHPYRHYSWWYVIPGKEQDLEAVAREYVALYQEKGIDTGWRIFQSVMGPDNPMYLVVQTATDPAAFHARQQEIRDTLGEAGQKLSQKAMQFARRIEENDAWVRPDLSFPPMQQQVGAR